MEIYLFSLGCWGQSLLQVGEERELKRVTAISDVKTVCTFGSLHQQAKSARRSVKKSDLSVVILVLSANAASTASSSKAITAKGKETLITFKWTPTSDLKMAKKTLGNLQICSFQDFVIYNGGNVTLHPPGFWHKLLSKEMLTLEKSASCQILLSCCKLSITLTFLDFFTLWILFQRQTLMSGTLPLQHDLVWDSVRVMWTTAGCMQPVLRPTRGSTA